MKTGDLGSKNAVAAIAVSAERRGSKEIRKEAKRIMKERQGVDVEPKDMNYQELTLYVEYIDYLSDIYKAAADF